MKICAFHVYFRNRVMSVSTQSGARSFGGSSLKSALSKTLSDKGGPEQSNKKDDSKKSALVSALLIFVIFNLG